MARKKPGEGEEAALTDSTSFEEALASLEAIVAEMEEQQLPLEELVMSYEKGSKLLKHCETVLNSARRRLQTISERQTGGGNSRQAPDSLDAEQEMSDDAAAPPAATDDDDDDDIRLF